MQDDILYRALFEQTNDAVFIMDLSGHYLRVNKRASEMLGYHQADLVGESFTLTIADNEVDHAIRIVRRLIQGEVIQPFERMFKRHDGKLFPAEIHLQLVYDDDGKPLHIQNVARDITDRKIFEDRVHFQASLLENVSEAIISTDSEGAIKTWNIAAEEIYGWSAKEVMGHQLGDVIETTYTAGKHNTVHHVKQRYLTQGYWSNEVIQKTRDGVEIYMLNTVSILRDADNNVSGTVSVSRDISGRKRAELGLQRYIDQMEALRQVDVEISSTLELEKVLVLALNAAVHLSGADAGFIMLMDNETGKHQVRGYGDYSDIGKQLIKEPTQGITGRAVKRKQSELVIDVRHDPDYILDLPDTICMMVFPLISVERIVGVINLESNEYTTFTPEIYQFISLLTNHLATSLDNARLYQKSQVQLRELSILYEQVSNLESLKTDMIRIASHDLRNPVGLVAGYVALLKEDLEGRINEDETDFLDSITSAVDRMQNIINEILSLERIQEAAKDEVRENLDLNALSEIVFLTHKPEANTKSQTMVLELAQEGTPIIFGDRAQLHEALSNFVTNAIKYTPKGGEIYVRVTSDGETASVKVEDNGYGIIENQQQGLFTPFFRAKSVETENIKGVGLGLSLVKNIIERHHGRVIFESVYGEGSTFGFSLPLVEDSQD